MQFPETDQFELYGQFRDHVGGSTPPVAVLRALYSLLPSGTDSIQHGFAQKFQDEMEVRWQLFALAGERIIIVDAAAALEDWTSSTADVEHELDSWLVPVSTINSLGVAATKSQTRDHDSGGKWITSYLLRMPWEEYRIPKGEIAYHPLVQKQLEEFTQALVSAMHA
ncbi:hypothetical protein [Aeromicrobium fastidiosum]|uniref:Uncharacterized protein n=1 Tax=Aeromicrobium fastidiosum TaxID=52699 RepID=A0A641AMG7_9ACTN|nr:hypothetical protein [Aeromicrobium fastidiosum]KAA1378313.1 hypothetical protein ESP62_008035 [Aeromicrobium fastidiosum]MBP2392744.1 hypothetical protein [Aeromicrobium fastidiosum]